MNKRSNGKMKYRMLSILGLVIFFGVWEAAVRLVWVSHRSLNAPSEVVETFTIIRPDIIIVGMFTIGLTGAMLNGILGLFEKKVAPWRYRDNG